MSLSNTLQNSAERLCVQAMHRLPSFLLPTGKPIRNRRGDTLAPNTARSLKALQLLNGPDFTELPLQEARALIDHEAQLSVVENYPLDRIESRQVGGVPCRMYIQDKHPTDKVVVYLHGGGWALGSLDSHDITCRYLARVSRTNVLSVDYRLSPEHPFPAGLDDVNSVLDELLPDTTVMLVGDSAGGNLALASTISRIQKGKPLPIGLIPIVPVTNLATMDTPSYTEFAEGFFLTKAQMVWYRQQYIGHLSEEEAENPLVSPLFASDEVLAKFPPTTIVVAGFDPLRDEGHAMYKRLVEAGVEAYFTNVFNQAHPFVNAFTLWQDAAPFMHDIGKTISDGIRGDMGNLLW